MAAFRNVMITGAHRGLGRALTRAYLNVGARVFPLVRAQAHADELSRSDSEHCIPLVGDVCEDKVMGIIGDTLSAHGGELDMLVNNAGGSGRSFHAATLNSGHLRQQFDVHCVGAMRCAKAALPFLQRSGRGLVVNLSSRLGSLAKNAAGEFSNGGFSYDYRIAKAAQNMLTLCLSQELSPRGVNVCALHPGRLRTDSGSADADMDADIAATRFVSFFSAADECVNGKFFDLFEAELPW